MRNRIISSAKTAFRHAISVVKTRYKYPTFLLRSNGYFNNDNHQHICIAARLLDSDDFERVCPYKLKGYDVESSDACDSCKYFCALYFRLNESGCREISIVGSESVIGTWEEYRRLLDSGISITEYPSDLIAREACPKDVSSM